MLLNELMRVDYAPKKLISQIEFVADDNETSLISKRLPQKRIKPTLDNIKPAILIMTANRVKWQTDSP